MTLVVSDITRHGIVMVGDSAITISESGRNQISERRAAKVQYSSNANIGLTMWGNANVNGIPTDSWINDFLNAAIVSGDDLESVGQRIIQQLNSSLSMMNKSCLWFYSIKGNFIEETGRLRTGTRKVNLNMRRERDAHHGFCVYQ